MSCPRLSFCAIHRSSGCRPVCVVSKNPRGTRLLGAEGRTAVTAPPMSTWPKLEELRHRAALTVRSITLGRRRGARLAITLGRTQRRRGRTVRAKRALKLRRGALSGLAKTFSVTRQLQLLDYFRVVPGAAT